MNVLIFLHPGTNSRCQFIDIIRGFEGAGHKITIWDTTDVSKLLVQHPKEDINIREQVSGQIAKIIRDQKIDLSVGMWSNGLAMTSNHQVNERLITFFERMKCPHLLMWLDSPERAHQASLGPAFKTGFFGLPYLFHFINNPSTASEMREVYGFDNVFPGNYGVNANVFKPYPDEPKRYDLIFNSNYGNWDDAPAWVAEELGKNEPDMFAIRAAVAESQRDKRKQIVERYAEGLRSEAEYMIERLAKMQVENRERPMLERFRVLAAEGSGAAKLTLQEPELYAAVATQIRRIEMFEREFVFVHLSKFFNCGLFGVVDYSRLGCNVKSFGAVNYEDQAKIYNQGKIGLSVMRWEDEAGFHVKPYEITASGVACLAQGRRQTEHLFAENELVRFRTLSEARRKIGELLNDPAKLQAVAEAGRARTLRDHTWAHWANDMIGRITEWQSRQAYPRMAA